MKKSQKVETKVYELLGVKQFRKAAFKLEKIVHRKDKRKNTNYHIQKNEVDSLGEFKKYLYYNGAIHTSNLIRGIPLLVLMSLLDFKVLSIIVLSTLLLKDAYCVMLQRYNWIKLSEKEFNNLIKKHINKIDFVKVILNDDSAILGFIVKSSDEFIMIEETSDFSMAGIKIVPYERVKSIRR